MPELEKEAGELQARKREDMAIKIAIKSTGSLELDEHVLHPFVKMHFVDMRTNKYLSKEAGVAGTSSRESVQLIDTAHNI